MINRKKKILSFILCLAMVIVLLSGCGKEDEIDIPIQEEEETTEEVKKDISIISTLPEEIGPGVSVSTSPEIYANIDLSTPYTVNICLLGDAPKDWDKILAAANDYLKPYNTSINTKFVSWVDYQDKYLKTIEGDSDLDLVFTAPWCYLYYAASKDIFYPIDTKFAGSYMPLTYNYQKSASWDETTINGKTIAIPSNTMDNNGKMVAIRQDIADELGINELSSLDDYLDYLVRVAAEITPETGIYALAAEGENKELWDLYRQDNNEFYSLESDFICMMYKYDGEIPTYDEIEFIYETQLFKDYAYDMKMLYDAGCWSGTALYGTKSDDEAFADLTGASISWNKSVFKYVSIAEQNEGVECEVYFLSPNSVIETEAYSNNCMAILASSKNPERAAMVLDLLKFDTYLNHLFILGIEGEHYTINETGEYTETALGEDAYKAGSVSISWAIKNGDISENYVDKREASILAQMDECVVAKPTVTFVFDDSKVKNEVETVNTVLSEYVPRLQLGKVRSVDAEIEAMLDRCYASGLQKIKDEYKSQYEAWLATR